MPFPLFKIPSLQHLSFNGKTLFLSSSYAKWLSKWCPMELKKPETPAQSSSSVYPTTWKLKSQYINASKISSALLHTNLTIQTGGISWYNDGCEYGIGVCLKRGVINCKVKNTTIVRTTLEIAVLQPAM